MFETTHPTHIDSHTLRAAVDQVGAGVVVTNDEGIIEYVNPSFLEISGYDRDEIIGHSTRLLKSGAHGRTIYEELWRTISSGKQWEGELINRHKDGSLYHVSCSIAPVFDESGNIRRFIQICVDVTEKTKLQELMRQRDKLESLGALASGIAHDFRNVLSAIVNQADLARNLLTHSNKLSEEAEVRDSLELILSTAHHAGDLVQRLLDFSAPAKSLTPSPLSLHHELTTVTRILGSSIPAELKLMTQWKDIDQWVIAYPFAIQQVLLNLGLNAADAIGEEEGFIRMEARPLKLSVDHPAVSDDGLTPGRYIDIRVIDNGPGIPEAVRDKIFEPFFSTKARRDRSGLGLAMVARLIAELRGHITFESVLGVGTRFEILLPLVDAPVESTSPVRLIPAIEESANGEKDAAATLLFLEDDPTISKGARIILESCGFTVEHYAHGHDALKAISARARPFDVVLCDFHLPDMNATELIRRALEKTADQRFVLVSGSIVDESNLGSVYRHVSRVFKKPMSYFTIARELHELLENDPKVPSPVN